MTFGKDDRSYYPALAILHEEVEPDAWFSEYLSEGPSGHFRRGAPGACPLRAALHGGRFQPT
jgi:ferritin-like protein